MLSKCYENSGINDSAIIFYNKAILINPKDPQITYNLANLYREKGDLNSGILLTCNYLEYDSIHTGILKINGLLNYLNDNFNNSIRRFNQCISQKDTSLFVYKYLGFSYFKNKEFEEAKNFLEKAFFLDTTSVEVCYLLGLACHKSVYRKLGIDYLNRTIDLITPRPSELSIIYQNLAEAHAGLYRYKEASDYFLKALSLTPKDSIVVYNIARNYDIFLEDEANALKYYKEFTETLNNCQTDAKIPKEIGSQKSLYQIAEERIKALNEAMFWKGKVENSP
jgi:tetratricopeptide (TPR) repeat protein